MEQKLFDDLIKGLNEAIEYAEGDKSKGRSMVLEIPDNEVELSHLLYSKIVNLSETSMIKAIKYVDELATSG